VSSENLLFYGWIASLFISGIQLDLEEDTTTWKEFFTDRFHESTLLEEDFKDFSNSEFEKAWSAALEIQIDADVDLFPPLKKKPMSTATAQDLQEFFNMLDVDIINWDGFDHNTAPSVDDLEKLLGISDPIDMSQSPDLDLYLNGATTFNFGQGHLDEPTEILGLELAPPEVMAPTLTVEVPEDIIATIEPMEVVVDSIAIPPTNGRSSSRRKSAMIVRDFTEPPSAPAIPAAAAITRGRKRKASVASAAEAQIEQKPTRRSKTEKPKKEKMWQKKDDPQSRDAVLARERREKKKQELQAAHAKIRELEEFKEDVRLNYIHKHDREAMVRHMFELGLAVSKKRR